MSALKLSPGCRCCDTCVREVTIGARNCFEPKSGVWQLAVTGSPDGGSFTLRVGGGSLISPGAQMTGPIDFNASSIDVQKALANLSGIGSGNVTCSGPDLPDGPIKIEFTGDLAGTNLALAPNLNQLTGGESPGVSVMGLPGNVPPDATAVLTSDESQSISISNGPAVGGSFTLSFDGDETDPIPWYATTNDVINALEALPSIGPGNLKSGPDIFPGVAVGAWVVTFVGRLKGEQQDLIKADWMDADGISSLKTTGWGLEIGKGVNSGWFKLSFAGQGTSQIPWNATAGDVESALSALPTVGEGNVSVSGGSLPTVPLTIQFKALLDGTAAPLTVAVNNLQGAFSQSLTLIKGSDLDASVVVAQLLKGGQELGPIHIDPDIGVGTFDSVPIGEWEWTVSATDYKDVSSFVDVVCPPKTPPQVIGTAVVSPVDGKIITPGNPAPQSAPSSANLLGDPGGASSLDLVSCKDGTAVYFGTGGPGTLTVPCPPPCVGDCVGPAHWTRQSWFLASFGCAQSLTVIWTMEYADGPVTPFCINASDCLPKGTPGNGSCSYCDCTDSFWGRGGARHAIPCGPCGTPDRVGACVSASVGPGAAALIGGGCFAAGMAPPFHGTPDSAPVPGWVGPAVDNQIVSLWGEVVLVPPPPGSDCASQSFAIVRDIPCITVSLEKS
jgi:hypothetical protein